MRIVADENIPMVNEYFGQYGEITRLAGRSISPEDVMSADILLVRSVTEVNERLLRGASVKFVGSATIGEDHIDTSYLKGQGVAYSNAPGANATSVVEYVFAAIIEWCCLKGRVLDSLSIGIIGVGSIGKELARVSKALGLDVFCYDPPQNIGASGQVPSAVMRADIISIHTPLTTEGSDPTYHLVDDEFLNALSSKQLLINSSRGAVVNNDQLTHFLSERSETVDVVLDVWEGEPSVNLTLVDQVLLATPHIAGYSFDGKVQATAMLAQSYAQLFAKPYIGPSSSNVGNDREAFGIPAHLSLLHGLSQAVRYAFDIRIDDRKMRRLKSLSCSGSSFDSYRKNYPKRREFSCFQFNYSPDQEQLAQQLKVMGFHIAQVCAEPDSNSIFNSPSATNI